MKIYLSLLLLTIYSVISFGQNAPRRIDALRITDYISRLPSAIKITMAVEGVSGEEFFSYRPTVRVPSASVIKIPILLELMEKVKVKQIDLEKIYTLQASDKAGGSGVIANMPEGKKFTIRELAQEMIRSSDNTATNILIRAVGMDAVNQNLMRLGSTKTRLNRIMMDTMAVKQGRENYVNTVEINDLLRKIYNKEVATPALCEEMIEILKNCGDTTTIPRNLPKDVVIAHKTGGLTYVRGDAAIIYTPKPFIVSIFVEGFKEETTAERIIGELAEICWENLK
ncbi:serine hydrolase [Emticicia sp. BO119]|uniref:serine hydrolase n=1 Tax=Emticicia sp. BO119 TaxID=2757768 RepID=UPI0015F0776C|nr:serine hydrolase [Emticicia sp. BO119]MBA4850945.1 serine hydrolase [Emticicia sp. BO119]